MAWSRERFESKVVRGVGRDACDRWTGAHDEHGYGAIYVDGRQRKAHRVAWEIEKGAVPVGRRLRACEKHRDCVNPDHLVLVADSRALPARPTERRPKARGHKRRRGTAWELVGYAGIDPRTRRARYASRTFRGTEKQADRALEALVREVDDGRHQPGSETTVEGLIARWIEIVSPNLSPSTLEGYRGWSRRAIVPKLGKIPVAKLDVMTIEDFYRTLVSEGLSALSVRHVHAVLRRALVSAQRWGWIVANPAALAEPPRAAVKEQKPPSPAEARGFIAWCIAHDEDDLAVVLRLAAISGARRGELVALRWSDVDFETGHLTIARAMTGAGGAITEKKPKSGKVRRLALDPSTLDLLNVHRGSEIEKSKYFRVEFTENDPIFTTVPGESWTPGALSKRYSRAQEASGFGPTLHAWRHFSATVALAAGNTPRQVADRLGHSTPVITMTTYAHSIPAADSRLADDLAAALAG